MSALLLGLILGIVAAAVCAGATHTTPNFVVTASTAGLAQQVAEEAERRRRDLAVEWLGAAMPRWADRCVVEARVSPAEPASGATSFLFDRGEVYGWRMVLRGDRRSVVESVLPHEVLHTVLATRLRRRVPRWADEGAATMAEAPSEIAAVERVLVRHLKTGRGVPTSALLRLTEYPADVSPLYAQGHSLTTFLVEQRGKQPFVAFLDDATRSGDWRGAVQRSYGYRSLGELQQGWMAWVVAGRPRLAYAAKPGVAR